jgi:hypothetical protein
MTITQVEVAAPVANEPAEPATGRKEWRWIPDPEEAEEPGAHPRWGSGSTWNDTLIMAMAWAKRYGSW